MAEEQKKANAPGGQNPERAQLMNVLVPAGAIGVIIILVAVIAGLSGGGRSMSDGSDGSAEDSGLKEAMPGVKYRDLKEGTGEPCPQWATVKVRYTGWLTDSTVFDSSKGNAVTFSLAGVVPGWQFGIPGMKPGGIRKLVISPDKGYGNRPKGDIPAGSTLIFEVELVDFVPPPAPPKPIEMRPRRSPPPTNLAKLSDGTEPQADDPNLKPIGTDGLQYRDIKEGDGPAVPPGARVAMDYTGWRRTDGHMFDSSWKAGGKPLEMALGELIPGWQQGVPGMKVGGIRKLVIPSALGYGARGAGSDIPPNTPLVFEIELLGFQ